MSDRIFVFPGYVISQSDGGRHYIGFRTLCRLYLLSPAMAIDMSKESCRQGYMFQEGDKHYHPSPSGDYPLLKK